MARGRTTRDSDTGIDTDPEFATTDDSDAYGRLRGEQAPDEPLPRSSRVRPVKRARFGVVVLTVLLTEIVLIGAALNQGVSKHLASYASDHPSALLGRFVRSLLVLRWRVSPASGLSDLWHTELITVGLVLLLGLILVPMAVHGAINWLRAFIATWMTVTVTVVVATVAALVLSDLEESQDLTSYVVPGTPSTGLSIGTQIGNATFGPVASYAFVAGLALGLVTAFVVAGIVAASRRRDPVPVAAVAAGAPPAAAAPEPFFGDTPRPERRTPSDSPFADTRAYAPPARNEDATATSSLRRSGVSGIAGAGAGYAAGRSVGDDVADDAPATNDPGTSDPATSSPADETTALPRVDRPAQDNADAGTTSELPSVDRPVAGGGSTEASAPSGSMQSEGDSERTAAFPLPPDDEDLGHDPRHDND